MLYVHLKIPGKSVVDMTAELPTLLPPRSETPELPPSSFLSRECKNLAASISGNIEERGLESQLLSFCGKFLSRALCTHTDHGAEGRIIVDSYVSTRLA